MTRITVDLRYELNDHIKFKNFNGVYFGAIVDISIVLNDCEEFIANYEVMYNTPTGEIRYEAIREYNIIEKVEDEVSTSN